VAAKTGNILSLEGQSRSKFQQQEVFPGDLDNDRLPEMAKQPFRAPVLTFLAARRCSNHLAEIIAMFESLELLLEFRRHLS